MTKSLNKNTSNRPSVAGHDDHELQKSFVLLATIQQSKNSHGFEGVSTLKKYWLHLQAMPRRFAEVTWQTKNSTTAVIFTALVNGLQVSGRQSNPLKPRKNRISQSYRTYLYTMNWVSTSRAKPALSINMIVSTVFSATAAKVLTPNTSANLWVVNPTANWNLRTSWHELVLETA